MGCGASKGGDGPDKETERDNGDAPPSEFPTLEVEGGPKSRGPNRRISVSAESVDMAKLKLEKTRVIPKTDEEKEKILSAVSTNFLFNNLEKKELDIVLDAVERREHRAGDTVIQQGDEGNEFFILDSGECECFVDFKDGNPPKMVKEYKHGMSFGELALMYMTPRAATIKATTDVVCWVMDRLTFRKVIMTSAAAKREKYEGFLDKVDLLKSLDKYERASIADALVEAKYKDGEYIITEGDNDATFYFLEYGAARATKVLEGKGPDPVEVFRYKPGEYFGELALITSQPRAANIVAEGDNCVVVSLSKDAFTRLIGSCVEVLKRDATNYSMIEAKLKGAKMDTESKEPEETKQDDEVV
jgi:cAMP-dependent protein kinase regulator